MTLHVSISGARKRVTGVWVSVGGVWKKVLSMNTSVVGTFKLFFIAGLPVNPLAGGVVSSTAYSGASNSSSMTFQTTGAIDAATSGVESTDTITGQRWFTDNPDQAYEVYATLVSTVGTGSTTGTFGVWLPLNTPRTFGVDRAGGSNGVRTVTMKFKIRRVSDSVVVSNDTNSYTVGCATSTGAQP